MESVLAQVAAVANFDLGEQGHEASASTSSFMARYRRNVEANNSSAAAASSEAADFGLGRDRELDDKLKADAMDAWGSGRGGDPELARFRRNLPAFAKKSDVLEMVRSNQVVVVSGETGCGKTTQVIRNSH